MSECCSEHPGVFVLGCWQGTLRAIDAAREQYDDPLERLIYVTERIGGLDRYDWPMIARRLRFDARGPRP